MDYLSVGEFTAKESKRFWKNIVKEVATGCWQWIGAKDAAGYGLCFLRGRTERIHRVMYAALVCPIPRGVATRSHAQLDHKCRNTSCCNPEHLELVTQKENVLRGVSVVATAARKTHCKRGHLLTLATNGKTRECRICDNARHKARKVGDKAEYWRLKAKEAAQRWRDRHPGKAAEATRRYRRNNRAAS